MLDPRIAERLMPIYLAEVEEHVTSWRRDLRALDEALAGSRYGEILSSLHRTAHTLKGASRVVTVDLLAAVGWRLETLVKDLLKQRTPPAPDTLTLLAEAGEAIQDAAECLRDGRGLAGTPLEELERRLTRLVETE